MSNKPEFDVFLAHNSEDKPLVREIARKLRQCGLNPWIDEEQIPPGRPFQDYIQQAVLNARSVAIFIGPNGLGKWQMLELRSFISQFVNADIPVIPVLLPGVKRIPEGLPFLNELNWVSFANGIDDVETLERLVSGITQQRHSRLTDLENLLGAGRWREANELTRTLILKKAGQEKEGYLKDEEIQRFPRTFIRELDTLWHNYSNGKFGFMVQKNLMIEHKRDHLAFSKRVGWLDQNGWISASRVIYNPTIALEGHLPWGMLQVYTMDNAAFSASMDIFRMAARALVKEDWHRQIVADFIDLMGHSTGDTIDKEEVKRTLEAELSHEDGWWKGSRIEELKVRKLFSLLVSC